MLFRSRTARSIMVNIVLKYDLWQGACSVYSPQSNGGVVVEQGGPEIIDHPKESRFKDFLQHVL